MLKEQLHLSISAEASIALAELIKRSNTSKNAVVESLLIDAVGGRIGLSSLHVSVFDSPAPATAEKQRESARFRGSFPKPGKNK
jgi:hypothetical protein